MARDPLARPDEAIKRLYAYVAYRIGPGPDAEDVVSETIERALRYRHSYDPRKGSANAWLIGIAARVIANEYSARSRRALDGDWVHQDHIDDFSATSLLRVRLLAAIGELDVRSRELLALRYGGDLRAREIAEIMGLSTNATEVALSRALGRLRELLDEPGAPSRGPVPAGASGTPGRSGTPPTPQRQPRL